MSEAKKIIKLLERIVTSYRQSARTWPTWLVAKRRGISGRMRRSRNCSNSHASAFRPVRNDDEFIANYPAARE